jgi:cellulose synthase/poly-beta-1,6-N-acetylglucosamine synthase-like glycosyltransferase
MIGSEQMDGDVRTMTKTGRCIGVVVIGRDEGERLPRCLASIGDHLAVVYADSGSKDGSCAVARAHGALVVELDASLPFTAARGRNEGLARLLQEAPGLEYVQFVDGDCELVAGWLEAAVRTLDARPEVAAVCGRLKEKHPERSIYNQLCQIEWNGPTGEVKHCGGIAMYRVAALKEAGGFNPTLMAGEEPELCMRLRAKGGKLLRICESMAMHDSDMMNFGQWWRRSVRSGYGGLEVVRRFDRYRRSAIAQQIRSSRFWTLGLPLLVLMAGLTGWLVISPLAGVIVALLVAMVVPGQVLRLTYRAMRRGEGAKAALAYGLTTMINKWGVLYGQIRYLGEVCAGRKELRGASTEATEWVP